MMQSFSWSLKLDLMKDFSKSEAVFLFGFAQTNKISSDKTPIISHRLLPFKSTTLTQGACSPEQSRDKDVVLLSHLSRLHLVMVL